MYTRRRTYKFRYLRGSSPPHIFSPSLRVGRTLSPRSCYRSSHPSTRQHLTWIQRYRERRSSGVHTAPCRHLQFSRYERASDRGGADRQRDKDREEERERRKRKRPGSFSEFLSVEKAKESGERLSSVPGLPVSWSSFGRRDFKKRRAFRFPSVGGEDFCPPAAVSLSVFCLVLLSSLRTPYKRKKKISTCLQWASSASLFFFLFVFLILFCPA